MALLRRPARRFFVRLRYLPCALLALGEAFLKCWMLLLFAFLTPLLLVLSGQGRQALVVSADLDKLIPFYVLFFSGVVLIGIYARLIIDSASLSVRPNRAKRYARRCAPDLVAVAASFALPLLLHYGTKNPDPSLERISLLIIGFVPFFSVGLKFSILGVSSWKESKYELYALLMIVIIYGVSFWAFNSALMQFVILITTTALTFWFFPYCFLQNKKTQLDEFKKIVWSGFFLAGFILLNAYLLASSPVENGQTFGATYVLVIAALAYVSVGYLLSWGFWCFGRLPCSQDNPVPLGALRLVLLTAIAWRLLSASFGDAELRTIRVDGGNPSDATSYLNEWIASRNAHATKERPWVHDFRPFCCQRAKHRIERPRSFSIIRLNHCAEIERGV
jgi:hypothetical protein